MTTEANQYDERLKEALLLLPKVMRSSLSDAIIGKFNEQAAAIDHMKRTANARRLAFEAVMSDSTLIEALQEARTQISILQSMRGIVDTGHGTLSIIDAALEKAGVKVETGEEVA